MLEGKAASAAFFFSSRGRPGLLVDRGSLGEQAAIDRKAARAATPDMRPRVLIGSAPVSKVRKKKAAS